MTLFGWFLFFLVVQAIHFLGTWKLYVAAGRKAWGSRFTHLQCGCFNENH